jgi:ABC-type multidrug transport system fused ATPase/permease subunit
MFHPAYTVLLMLFNRIMVLDNGLLAEYASPKELLEKENGVFRSLWEKHLESHGGEEGNAH